MNAKISGFVICIEVIMYLWLYILHDYTFKFHALDILAGGIETSQLIK